MVEKVEYFGKEYEPKDAKEAERIRLLADFIGGDKTPEEFKRAFTELEGREEYEQIVARMKKILKLIEEELPKSSE